MLSYHRHLEEIECSLSIAGIMTILVLPPVSLLLLIKQSNNSFQLYFVNTKAFVCFLTPFNGQKQTYIIQFYVRDHLRNSLRHSSVVSRFYLLIGKGGLRPFSQSLRIVNIDRHLLHGVYPTKLFCSYIK